MLDALKKIFSSCEETPPSKEVLLQRASALLMLEVANADDDYTDAERKSVLENLSHTYNLSDAEAQVLLDAAESEIDDLLSIQGLTRLMVNELEMEDRIYVVEQLWKIAFSDHHLDHYEDHTVRKIADLLYVSHNDFIKAKIRIQDAL